MSGDKIIVWSGGVPYSIQSLLAPGSVDWTIISIDSINNVGQMAGFASRNGVMKPELYLTDALERDLPRAVDDAHAALTEYAKHLIAVDHRQRPERHLWRRRPIALRPEIMVASPENCPGPWATMSVSAAPDGRRA